jgi:hypothetical protein
MFIRTRVLHGWTSCAGCHDTCWLGTQLRACSLCSLTYHEGCFAKAVLTPGTAAAQGTATVSTREIAEAAFGTEEAETTPGAQDDGHWRPIAHVHELYWARVLLPMKCDKCSARIITLGVQKSLTCVDCDAVFHGDCGKQLPEGTAVILDENDQSAREVAKSSAMLQQQTLSETLALISHFNEKNRNWFLTVANPLAMRRLQQQQSKLYIEACAALPTAMVTESEFAKVRRALRFATAAYGVAYETGHMSDAMSNVLMRVMKREMMAPKAEPNNLAVTQILQLHRDALLYSRWGKSVFDPSYCVLLDHEASWIVLAFRGSLSDADFLTDACGHLVPFCGGMAHKGMVTMIDKVLADSHLLACLRSQRSQYPQYRLLVTGHSLGAGLATLFLIRMVKEPFLGTDGIYEPPAETSEERRARGVRRPAPEGALACSWAHGIAFAPPPVLTMPLADCFDSVLTSIVVGKDMVCRLQLPSVDRLGVQLAAKGGAGEAGVAHLADGIEECFISGKIFFSPKPNHLHTRLTHLDRTSVLLRDLFISTSMIMNHVMDSYGLALAAVAASVSLTGSVSPPTERNDAGGNDAAPAEDEEGVVVLGQE